MSSLIVNASNFAPATQMVYGKPRVNTKGGKSINITNSGTRRSLMISTPMMLTYGVNEHKNDDGTTSYDMNIQFPREEFETVKAMAQKAREQADALETRLAALEAKSTKK